jgi:methylase of polypeptide subunit release factors
LSPCVLHTGEDLEELVEQQLWGDAASASTDQDGDSNDGGSSGGVSIGSLAAGAADDKGLAAWDVNMKALKTAAYDLGRLPKEVRRPAAQQAALCKPFQP